MRAPQRLVVQLEHQIVRRVVHHADLLEHHLPLEQQILAPQQRMEDEIADHVGGLHEVLVEHARLERRVLAGGVRVERAAEHLERERDVARGAAAVPLNTMCSSRCETPICSRRSCTDAARTQAPNDTDRTPGMCSESTVSPFEAQWCAARNRAATRRRSPARTTPAP